MHRLFPLLAAVLLAPVALHAQSPALTGERAAAAEAPASDTEAEILRRMAAVPLVARDRSAPLQGKANGEVWQDNRLIGRIRRSGRPDAGTMERWTVALPDGTPVAELSWEDGGSSVLFTVKTAVDGVWHPVERRDPGPLGRGTGLEPVFRRVLPWLVEEGYW